ncbi:MAG: MerR family transcriptional regulator [Candidatus Anammoxibacter sp.]
MKIGQLAKETGIKTGTILYYEKRKLLSKPPRLSSGYRVYSNTDIERISFIKNAKNLGFTLAEIIELLQMINRKCAGNEFKRFVEGKIGRIENCITKCKKNKRALVKLTSNCIMGEKRIDMSCPFLKALFRENRA